MRIEILDDSTKYRKVIIEALEIISRVRMNSGEFSYRSQVFYDTRVWPLKDIVQGFGMVFRPPTGLVKNSQPTSHQYVELFPILFDAWAEKGKATKWAPKPIARFHF